MAETAGTKSAALGFQNEKLFAFTCDSGCKEGPAQLVEELPPEARALKKRVEVLNLKGDARLFWVRIGDDARYYSLLIVGASKTTDAETAVPEVVLRGWAGKDSKSASELLTEKLKEGLRLSLVGPEKSGACGRKLASSTRIYDPQKRRFKRVQVPVLSVSEREKSIKLSPKAEPGRPDELLVRISAATEDSASEPVDANMEVAWHNGYEFSELKVPSGQSLSRFAIALATPLSEPASFWLATETQVFRVELPAGEGKFFSVDLPPDDARTCVAAIQPQVPVPISEIMLRVQMDSVPTTELLVAKLSEAEPGVASDALSLRGTDAAAALVRAYPRMSRMARVRATDIADTFASAPRAAVHVAALEYGSQVERDRSLEVLKELRKEATEAIVARLPQAERAGRLQLSVSLAQLSPRAAIVPLSQELGRGSSAERLVLRRLFSDLAAQEEVRISLQKLLERQRGAAALSRSAQVELVRALLPLLKDLGASAQEMVLNLSKGANFEEAYLVAPAAFRLAPDVPELRESISAWLLGSLPKDSTTNEKSALSVRVLELLRESEADSLRMNKDVRTLLTSDNARVRRSAFEVLVEAPGSVTSAELTRALKNDDWPQVRAASAQAASSLSPASATGQELSRVLSRRLPRDEHAIARRAIARALGHIGDESSKKALRKTLKKDESYEVRAEAALSLGDLCDHESVEDLTSLAHELVSGAMDDGPILVGLASVSALTRLHPSDLDARMKPLLSKSASGVLRNQVQRRLDNPSGVTCAASAR